MKTFKEFIDEKKKDDDEDKDTRSQAVKDAERHDTEDDIFSDRVRKDKKRNHSKTILVKDVIVAYQTFHVNVIA